MKELLALSGIIVLCIAAVWIFRPRYGALRGCTGRALQASLEREQESRARQPQAAQQAPQKPAGPERNIQ